jgi:cell cycle sensor histidine kinase DivJ
MAPVDALEDDSVMRPPLADVFGWHLAWSLGVIVGGGLIALSGLTSAAIGALILALAPPVVAQVLLRFDGERARTALLGLWSICVGAACALAGGLAGPLTPWLLAPTAVGGVLGRTRMLAKGAAFSVAATLIVLLLDLAGLTGPQITGLPYTGLSLLALLTTALGLGWGLMLSRRSGAGSDAAVLKSVLEHQPHLVVLVDPDGRVRRCFGASLKGVARSRLAGGLERAARSEDRAAVVDAIQAARSDGRSRVGFCSATVADIHLVMDLRHLGDGRLVGAIRDDSEERHRNEAIEAARREAEAGRKDAESLAAGKSRFLASMSHELRTPLNAILGFSDVMRQKMFGDMPGKYVEYAQLIHESGTHLLDLITDVLDMSKIEANRYELSPEALDAREPVQAALRIVRVQADEAGVKLRAALPPKPIDVDADRRALKQIVLNLVSNAIKFTPRDGIVTVGLAARGMDLELVVADTGVGIAEEDLERIGRPYEQAAAGKKVQGTGLGLSLVRAFAELHGGEMTIESRLGAGTAVTIRLPVVHQEGKAAPGGENVVAFKPNAKS